ncbi:hypothetical protein EST38_g10411 [Candolleomyces aberdarensis]|uniref:Uncharacterized protein n=1 Tax=Candolleomyces aberdarensis TaxID=2316362 RepID=A0A4Q2D9V4_9AGAR|nr:hypothetical protein EST38_g10411 [Candolleomyces aberdarensis]
MKLFSAATVSTALVGLASALDLRLYTAINCDASFGWRQCGNLPAGVCCSAPDVPAAAMSLSSLAGVADFSGWGNQGCQAPLALRSSSGGCVSGGFAFFSGNWRSNSRIASAASDATTDCVDPDTFGFVDESGKEHTGKITAANKGAIDAAFKKGDIAALKTVAAAA